MECSTSKPRGKTDSRETAATRDSTSGQSEEVASNRTNFRYPPLSEKEIRVVHFEHMNNDDNIRGSFQVISLDRQQVRQYSALSYTWGNFNQEQYPITLDGQIFYVLANLFTALKTLLRCERSRVWWIDAICINQEDLDEKVHQQIPLMTEVYSRAQTVETWLGPNLNDGEHALQALASDGIGDSATMSVVNSVVKLLKRPWFERLWIVQELALAGPNAAYINCGNVRTSWDSFYNGVTQISKISNLNAIFEMESQQLSIKDVAHRIQLNNAMRKISLIISNLQYIRKNYGFNVDQRHVGVGAILHATKHTITSLPQDKVIGVCGLFMDTVKKQLTQVGKGDYEKVYSAATVYVLQNDFLAHLYCYFPTLRTLKKTIPSWTLDFSHTGEGYAERMCHPPKELSGRLPGNQNIHISDDGKELTVYGCVFGQIEEILTQEDAVQLPDCQEAWKSFWLCIFARSAEAILNVASRYLLAEEYSQRWITVTQNPMQLPEYPTAIDEQRDLWVNMLHNETELAVSLLNTVLGWLIKQFVDSVNLVTFLEKGKRLHEQAVMSWKGEGTSPSFPALVLAGTRRFLGDPLLTESLPSETQLEEELECLLSQGDDPLITFDMLDDGRKAIASALGVEDSKAISFLRIRDIPELLDVVTAANRSHPSHILTGCFITNQGSCGIAMPGARVGDHVAILFRGTEYEMPFIMRSEQDKKFSMVCPANIPDNWIEWCKAEGTFDRRKIVIV